MLYNTAEWKLNRSTHQADSLSMAHPQLENRTKLIMEPIHVMDRDGAPLMACVVKGTFLLGEVPQIAPADQQAPIEMAGEHYGEPEKSSLKYEPETAYMKPATDVVLIGHAVPQSRGASTLDVRLRIGPLDKTVRVFGNRRWSQHLGAVRKTPPEPIEQPIPLIYERAFGGWECAEPDPFSSRFCEWNPVGVGFPRSDVVDGQPLPNLEDPTNPLEIYGNTPPPFGFGFIGAHWLPRRKWAGTYDAIWQKTRAPLLPSDFSERFFNAASPGLISPEYLKGNEPVIIENAHPRGTLRFQLPAIAPPVVSVRLRGGQLVHLATVLDTVIINVDEMKLFLLWRARLRLRMGPHDVTALKLTCDSQQVQSTPQT
ncbi:MAG: DUF2169 domain-containing protein [Planctomycetales bacterium]|nr:DUF2169 domain-containing protein [Planctomycetales bacterium]